MWGSQAAAVTTSTPSAGGGPSSSSPDVVSATMEPPGPVRAPPAHIGAPGHSMGPNVPGPVHPLFGPPQSSQGPLMSPSRAMSLDGPPQGHLGTGGSMPPHTTLTSSENHQPSQSIVVPTPTRTRTIKSYHCRMCDQIFDNKSDLLVHSQTVHKADPKPYRCPTCQKCFANSSYLSQHARIHAGIKPYKCQICERRFTQLCHLQQHIRTHTGEKPYKCQHPGCGKAFSQLSNLQSHSRSHMTDKPYRCNSCYKCFTDEQGLRDHIPKHSETKHLKTFICRICGKSYTQETYLARHMTKHQGVDPVANMLNLTSLRHQQQQQAALQASLQQQQNQQQGHSAPTSANLSPGSQVSASMTSQHPSVHHMGHQPGAPPQHQLPTVHHHRQPGGPPDLPDIKPLLEGNGFDSQPDANKPSSAFMPLAHSYPSPNMMNTGVPSSFPFGSAPRLPSTTLNSPLSRLSPPVNSSPYFPFDFPKTRDAMDGRMEAGMITSLLRLQQIRDFSSSVFPKSEPTSPAHKDYTHKDYTHKDYT